ncbi:hypothetical protein OROMI_007868 [Orobanche minor]
MDEEESVKNVTRKIGKKSKSKSGKGKNNEEGSMGIQEVQSLSAAEVSEHVQVSGKEDTVEMKRDKKVHKVAKADIIKGTEGELTVACGEGGSGDAMLNVEKKRKKRENNYNMDVSRNCEVNATEIAERKKRKKEKKESKDYNWFQGTSVEANNSGVDLLSLQQKNVADSVGGNIESAKHGGNVTKELERKKKKNKKKGYNKDNSSVALEDNNVDTGSNGLMNTDEIQSSD